MDIVGCLVCDGDNAPASVKRVNSFLASMYPALNELQLVNVYTALLKAGVLPDLHGNLFSMMKAGISESEAVAYADDFLSQALSQSSEVSASQKVETSDYEDDWSFESETEIDREAGEASQEPDTGEVVGDGWGDNPFDDYSDDWF